MKKFAGFSTVVTGSFRSAKFRQVFFTFPNVAPPGAEWTSDHGGRKFELTSFQGGPVEVYVFGQDGIPMYQGTVRQYAPGEELRDALRQAWLSEQPSQAAKAAFEASASEETF